MKLSVSRINKFTGCAAAHHYGYVMELAPKVIGEALEFGTFIHEGLEHFYTTGNTFPIPDDLGEFGDKARSVLQTYSLYARMQDRFEVVKLEHEFQLPIDTGLDEEVTFHGVIDGVVRLQGELYVMEHKTCSQHWSDQRIQTALQHTLYELAVEEIFKEKVRGTIYNFLRTTKRGGDFHTDIKRVIIPANEHERQVKYDTVVEVARAIHAGHKFRNGGDQCKWCWFFQLCQAEMLGGDVEGVKREFYQTKPPRDSSE